MKLSISPSLIVLAAFLCAFSESVSSRALPQTRDSASSNSTNSTLAVDDDTILNFALTLEHLENAFYTGGLSTFTESDFVDDGLPVWARGRFEEISEHEKTHVEFLTAALGDNATQACTYNFPYNTPSSFAALSSVLEGVGVSAYTGAAQFLSDKDHLTAAASILATEARQAAWVHSAVIHQNPWSTAFETPLSLDVIFTLASQFITSCPESNPPLPVRAFPALTIALPVTAGQTSAVSVNATAGASADVEGQFVAFFTGLETIFVPVMNGEVVIPQELIGTSYAVLTSSNSSADDSSITAGVAIVDLPFNSNGKPE